ncbi:hypothetical protein [Serratia phage X20]|uniref:Host specificity protein n=3 Tax=Winklervirus TaxID=2560256 RepID=A0A1Z1LZ81_9CAUD|nr:hypothetical protein FDI23_gp136 [Serratia phage CHI14]YP_010092285.1 hypothetical protein KNT72_gp134 [Serratia phage X20]ARW57559.1 hypothetical protein [Serratia phage CHI14]ARW57834.1 hypothetical protein [Serratia phage CBH8]ARW58107.1 hypothetical protein [Serratia phage X20]
MSILKKIVEFIRAKLGTFISHNTSIEDQYTVAANRIIDKIDQLRKRHVTSKKEIIRLNKLAEEKDQNAATKEREIRHILTTSPSTDVTTHAKLGLLYRRTAGALRVKATELVAMQEEIERTVVALDDQRADLAVKLEFIRESNAANSMGLSTAEDIVETAELAKVDVDTIISRIDTFNGSNATGVETTSADVAEYIESLKA